MRFSFTVRRVARRSSHPALHQCAGRCGELWCPTAETVRTNLGARNHLERESLRLKDLSDPFRMTALLKTELASVFLAGDAQ